MNIFNLKKTTLIMILTLIYSVFLFFILPHSPISYHPKDNKSNDSTYSENNITTRVVLIGDAGEPDTEIKEPVLIALGNVLKNKTFKSLVIFLGDNIYPAGLSDSSDEQRQLLEWELNEQIGSAVNNNASAVFIPGNHDWNQGKPGGLQRIINQNLFIKNKKSDNLKFLPENGCPGPEVFDFNNLIRVIILDTQWWLTDDRYKQSAQNCYPNTEKSILDSLDSSISSAENKFVIIAAHHPLNSYGVHGGYFNWKNHLFPLTEINKFLWIPLPIIGSLYPLIRGAGVSNQDLSSAVYSNMIEKFQSVLSKHNNFVFASGHEHSLQVLKGINKNLYLISGHGSSGKQDDVGSGDSTLFASESPGFMIIDIYKNSNILLKVFEVVNEKGNAQQVYSAYLRKKTD